jgi:hypothetical protein
MNRSKKNYPAYHLWWVTDVGESSYHSKRKKAFLLRIERLRAAESLRKLWFRVDYLPGVNNRSIVYSENEIEQTIKDARIFTAADEVRFAQNYWKEQL